MLVFFWMPVQGVRTPGHLVTILNYVEFLAVLKLFMEVRNRRKRPYLPTNSTR